MVRFVWYSIAIGLAISSVDRNLYAQQRRPKTIVFRPTAVVKTQWSPNSAATSAVATDQSGPAGPTAGPSGTGTAAPGPLPTTAAQPVAFTPGFSNSPTAGQTNSNPQSAAGTPPADVHTAPPPTNQQLQNPSGGYQLTHSGFTQNAYFSANNYFGPQFNDWSNTRTLPNTLSVFESFNRFQPDVISDAYFSLNSYVGSTNNQWSNLSSGSAIPNDIGGWSLLP